MKDNHDRDELARFFEDAPLDAVTKRDLLLTSLNQLTEQHLACEPYARIVDRVFDGVVQARVLSEVPFVPVRLFKSMRLSSVAVEDEFKVLVSSGTTGQIPSTIVLDRHTANLQRKALARVMQTALGVARMPMLIVDSRSILKQRGRFSARAAGVLGMMNFGRDHTWLLDEEMELDETLLESFLQKHRGKPILIFGFTFMVWKYLLQRLEQPDALFDAGGVLVHSGGWKKLVEEAVSREAFNAEAKRRLGVDDVFNFYGMVEQVGSVFLDCEQGHFHASRFSDVLVRDPHTLEPLGVGERGVVECLSVLPTSYPGHAILTEDLGVVHHHDGECPCGRPGTAFRLHGRIPAAEVRGCSDTHGVEAR